MKRLILLCWPLWAHADDLDSWVARHEAAAQTAFRQPQAPIIDAEPHGLMDSMRATWNSPGLEVYVPLRTWHNRAKYTPQQIAHFNETPWGIGIGKYRDTSHNTTHGIGAMVFLDSHNNIEPFVAYTLQKNFSLTRNQKLALGGFAGFTARRDVLHYLPIPVAWPYVAYSYKKFTVQGMYFPGKKGNGNIAFIWAKYRFQ